MSMSVFSQKCEAFDQVQYNRVKTHPCTSQCLMLDICCHIHTLLSSSLSAASWPIMTSSLWTRLAPLRQALPPPSPHQQVTATLPRLPQAPLKQPSKLPGTFRSLPTKVTWPYLSLKENTFIGSLRLPWAWLCNVHCERGTWERFCFHLYTYFGFLSN